MTPKQKSNIKAVIRCLTRIEDDLGKVFIDKINFSLVPEKTQKNGWNSCVAAQKERLKEIMK